MSQPSAISNQSIRDLSPPISHGASVEKLFWENSIRPGVRSVRIRTFARPTLKAVIILLVGLGALGHHSETEAVPPQSADPSSTVPTLVGTSSCANRGCHGGVARPGTTGSEYNTWLGADPHANAFLVLFDSRSEAIQEALGRSIAAYNDARCQSCHGYADQQIGRQGGIEPLDEDFDKGPDPVHLGLSGVGCESCHGKASNWLHTHYLGNWSSKPDTEKEKSGMRILRPTIAKARLCVSCHVGSNLDQEVNHDLIAAGHPRLNFEFLSFSSRIPTHWNQAETSAKRKANGQGTPNRASTWALGELVSLEASLGLLAHRAEAAAEAEKNPQKPSAWPEFTEYACFSCHHTNVDGGLRYDDGRSGAPGSFTWNSWMYPMTRALIEAPDRKLKVGADHIGTPLDELKRLMEVPYPEPSDVATTATRLSSQLAGVLDQFNELNYDRRAILSFVRSIQSDPRTKKQLTGNWDAVAQLHYAIEALGAAELEAISRGEVSTFTISELRRLFDELDKLRKLLEFPAAHNQSPGTDREPQPKHLREPGTPMQLREQIEKVLDLIET